MIPVSHAMSLQPAYAVAMAAGSMMQTPPDAPLDLSRSTRESAANMGDAPLDLSTKSSKRKSSESDDDVIVVGVQKRPNLDAMPRNGLAQQWRPSGGFVTHQSGSGYTSPHSSVQQGMVQRSSYGAYGYGSSQSRATVGYNQSYYSQQRPPSTSDLRSRTEVRTNVPSESLALSPRNIQKQQISRELMAQSSVLQAQASRAKGSSNDTTRASTQALMTDHLLRQRMLAQQQQRLAAHSASATSREPSETRGPHYSAMQQARSQQDMIRNMHYGISRTASYSSLSSPQSTASRPGSGCSLPSAHSTAPMQYQHIAYHSPRTYSATVTTSTSSINSSVNKYGYLGQTVAAAASYDSQFSQQNSRTSLDSNTYPRTPSLEPGERPSSRHKQSSPLSVTSSYGSDSGRRSGSLTPTGYQGSAQHAAAGYMQPQSVPLNRSSQATSCAQRNPVRSLMAAQIAKRQSPAVHGAFMRPTYPPPAQHRYGYTETAKSPLSPGSSSSQPTYPPAYNKASLYPQPLRTDLSFDGTGTCLNKPPSTPPGPHIAPPKPQSMPTLTQTTPSQLYPLQRTLHPAPYESHSNPPSHLKAESGAEKQLKNNMIDLSGKPRLQPLVNAVESESSLHLLHPSVSSNEYSSNVSSYSVTSTTISTTNVQSKAVSVMSVTSLPDGPRLYRDPDAPNRPPLQNEAAGAQMKFIPVANVNPIVQKSGRTLHPKKQVLYQSRLDDLKRDSPDGMHEDESRSSTDKPVSPPLKKESGGDEGSVELKHYQKEFQKVIREKKRVQDKPITVNRVSVETKKRRHSLGERKLHTVPIKERFKVKKMYRMNYHKNDMIKEEIDIKSLVCENQAYSNMCDNKETKKTRRDGEFALKGVDKSEGRGVSVKKFTRKRSADGKDKSSYNPDIDNDESTVEYEMPSPQESTVAEDSLDCTDVQMGESLPAGPTKAVVKRRRRRRPRDGFARKVTRRPKAQNRAKVKTEAGDEKGVINVRPGRKRHTSQSNAKPAVVRKGGRYDDPVPCTRTIKTRNQAAARPGLGRLSLYNKNASYERELRREEYRKFLLRIKRQNKRTHATELDRELTDDVTTPSPTKAENELRKLRPRRIVLDEEDEKPKRKIPRGRPLHTARKKYTLRSTPPKRAYWRKRGFIPVSEMRMVLPEEILPLEPLKPEAEIVSEMKKLVVCKDIGETVMHKAARLGNKKIILHILDTGMFEVDVRDNAGYTPLHESCVKGHLEVTKLLLARGADANACALDGTGPLHDAVDHGHMEITRLLLVHGADIRNSTCTGRTPMKVAARRPAMKKLLLGFLQDLNGLTEDNPTTIPWSFPSSCPDIDPPAVTGFDIFGDLPPEEDSSEGDFLFDLCDEPHLPVYHLFMGPDIGYRNCHLLKDITTKLRMNVRDFTSVFPTIPVEEIARDDFDSQIQDSGISSLDIRLLRNMDMVQVVEVSDKLMSVLGITRMSLKSDTLSPLQPLVIPPCDIGDPDDFPLDVQPKMESLLDSPPQEKCVASDGLPYTAGMFHLSPDQFRSHDNLSQPSFPRLGTGSPTDDILAPPVLASSSPVHGHNLQHLDLGSPSASLPPGPSCHRVSPGPLLSPRSCAPDQDSKVILDLDSSRTFTPISPPYHDQVLTTCAPLSLQLENRSIFNPRAGYPSHYRTAACDSRVGQTYNQDADGSNMAHTFPCQSTENYHVFPSHNSEAKSNVLQGYTSNNVYPPLPTAPAYPIPLSTSTRPLFNPHQNTENAVPCNTKVTPSFSKGGPPVLLGKAVDSIISENLDCAQDQRCNSLMGFRKVSRHTLPEALPMDTQSKKERGVLKTSSRSDHGLMIAKSPVILSSENLGEDDEVSIDRISTISGEIVNRVDKTKENMSQENDVFKHPVFTVTNSVLHNNTKTHDPKLAGEVFSNIINEHLIQGSTGSKNDMAKQFAFPRNHTNTQPQSRDNFVASSVLSSACTTNHHTTDSSTCNEISGNIMKPAEGDQAINKDVNQRIVLTEHYLGGSTSSSQPGAKLIESLHLSPSSGGGCPSPNTTGSHSLNETLDISHEHLIKRQEENEEDIVSPKGVPSLLAGEDMNALAERTLIAS